MHVLIVPKWYPGRNDPQLGDFIRKQAQAISTKVRTSVLFIHGVRELESDRVWQAEQHGELFELRGYFTMSLATWTPLRKAINLIRYVRMAKEGGRKVEAAHGRPDLVQAYILVRPALTALLLKIGKGIPFLISEQSSEYLNGNFARRSSLHKAFTRWLCSKASGFTAVSAHLGQAMIEQGLCKHVDVVPNVIPGTDRPLPPAGPPGHYLMIADLVDTIKNVSGALRALKAARSQDPRLQLRIIGDGPDRATLEALSETLGLGDSVEFLGQLPNEDVLHHIPACFAVIVNSNFETFSVVTGEGLAQGKPVIATRCGGPEAFIHDRNGMLIPIADDQSLSSAMLTLAKNASDYSPAAIRADLVARFGSEAVVNGSLSVYKRILDGRK